MTPAACLDEAVRIVGRIHTKISAGVCMEPAGGGQGDVLPAVRAPSAPHPDAPGAGPQCECAKDSGGRAARGEAPGVGWPLTPSQACFTRKGKDK